MKNQKDLWMCVEANGDYYIKGKCYQVHCDIETYSYPKGYIIDEYSISRIHPNIYNSSDEYKFIKLDIKENPEYFL